MDLLRKSRRSAKQWRGRAAPAVLCVAVTACGHNAASSDPSVHPSASTPVRSSGQASTLSPPHTPASTPPATAAAAAAVVSYLAMWQDFAAAGRTSDWQAKSLSEHATGDALLQMSRSLYADHYNGLITKGAPVNHPRATKVSPDAAPTTVLISDCGDSTHWLKYVAKTNRLANDSPGGKRSITAEVKRQPNGSWKVDRFAVEGLNSC
jgi:hypothetical protein